MAEIAKIPVNLEQMIADADAKAVEGRIRAEEQVRPFASAGEYRVFQVLADAYRNATPVDHLARPQENGITPDEDRVRGRIRVMQAVLKYHRMLEGV